MKRILIILCVILNSLLFVSILDSYKQEDLSNIHTITRFQDEVYNTWLRIENMDQRIDSVAMFDKFEALSKQYDLIISTFKMNLENDVFDIYIVDDKNINERFSLITDSTLNFNSTYDQYYTNQVHDSQGVLFFMLNRDITVRLLPMRMLSNAISNEYNFTSANSEELNHAVAQFKDAFGQYVTAQSQFENIPFDREASISEFLTLTIAISAICTFLLIIMYVQSQSKKIAIYKTLGTSLLLIGKKLLLPLYLLSTISIITTNVVLFIVFIRVINTRTLQFLFDLLHTSIYQIVGVAITLLLSVIMLMFVPTYTLLKNNNVNRNLMSVNYLLKIVILVVTLPILTERITNIEHHLVFFRYASTHDVDTYHFIPRFKPGYTVDDYDPITYFIEFFQDYDANIIYRHPPLYNYHEAYWKLNDAGAILSKSQSMFDWDATLIVNENFLRKYPIIDIMGDYIRIEDFTSDIVFLIAESNIDLIHEQFFTQHALQQSYEIIVISDQQEFFNFTFNWWFDTMYFSLPHNFFVYTDTSFRIDTTIFQEVFFNGDVNDILRDTVFYNRIYTPSMQEELQRIRHQRWILIQNDLVYVIPTIMLASLIISQYAYLFIKVFTKQIFVKNVLGYNPARIMIRLLLESSLAVFIAIIIAVFNQLDYRLLLMVLALDILVYLIAIVFTQKRRDRFRELVES